MDTPNSPSNGANLYPSTDALGASGLSQHQVSVNHLKQLASVEGSASDYLNIPEPPIEQPRSSPLAGDQQPAGAERGGQDHEMQDVSDTVGGETEKMPKNLKQPAPQPVVNGGSAMSVEASEKNGALGVCGIFKAGLRFLGLSSNVESELMRKATEMETLMEKQTVESRDAMIQKDDHLRWMEAELDRAGSCNAHLRSELERYQSAAMSHYSQVTILTAKIAQYKSNADRLTEQLSSLEQSNSRQVGGTGAHKDSHAIPPNLVKSVFNVNEAALACTKSFIAFLRERDALANHEALQNLPAGADERYRKHAVQAYICTRLFAGFENDSYIDSLDSAQCSRYLPAAYQETDFFLQNQDLEKRNRCYLREYEDLQKVSLQEVMDVFMRNEEAASNGPFLLFCCRKVVNIMMSVHSFEDFGLLEDVDYSKVSLLHQLAANPKYCDKFLKPFVKLAMETFLLHRLAFQFHPPARIFRYARGTRFDGTYMETVVPIDDDDSVEDLVVGLMLVPGFQVGATIVKCMVYLVHSGHAVAEIDSKDN